MMDFCSCFTCAHARGEKKTELECELLAESFEPGLVRSVRVYGDGLCEEYAHDAGRFFELHGIDVDCLDDFRQDSEALAKLDEINGVSPGVDFPATLTARLKLGP